MSEKISLDSSDSIRFVVQTVYLELFQLNEKI